MISAQQEKFIVEFIRCRKGSEAARSAGYSPKSAHVAASRLLSNDKVLAEIERRMKANAMSLDEALSRLADFARADLGQWMSDGGEIDLVAMRRDKATAMIRKVKRTRRSGVSPSGAEWEDVTVEVELHDAKDANKFIAELHSRGPSGTAKDPIHIKHIKEIRPDDGDSAAE